ncbi:hypothetical protein GH714_028780 [Hevea brasiliensis]|uniref:Uncharacterized protein n=1 Tax=Hevea brasiliensis TaxID=3981 RepID=A0A6A6MEP7_HEVBR|nr:hypothetical protein GH714_028780 [Hevea brasiliensis]
MNSSLITITRKSWWSAHLTGSVISNSGTSSPFPDKHPILEFRMGEAPKVLGIEHFNTRKRGSRLGSGSLTPDGLGLGSRLGSGSVTPDGVGLGSRLGSGSLTPDVDHRVSFELSGEEVARCLESKSMQSCRMAPECSLDREMEEEHYYRKHRSITLESIKEFNFDNLKEVPDKPTMSSEWWANETIARQEARPPTTGPSSQCYSQKSADIETLHNGFPSTLV